PQLGENWTGDRKEMRAGRGPEHDDEIAINEAVARAGGLHVGDRVGVLTRQPKQTFTLVGIFGYSGGRDSIGGAQEVAFTEPVAQRLMLGRTGLFSRISLKAAEGTSPETLRGRVAAAVGDAYVVKTGHQLAEDSSSDIRQALGFFNKILL